MNPVALIATRHHFRRLVRSPPPSKSSGRQIPLLYSAWRSPNPVREAVKTILRPSGEIECAKLSSRNFRGASPMRERIQMLGGLPATSKLVSNRVPPGNHAAGSQVAWVDAASAWQRKRPHFSRLH